MRFTAKQYQAAIYNLQEGMKQLEPDGENCIICGHDHYAFECPHNPLTAMAILERIVNKTDRLHEALHIIIGANSPYQIGWRTFLPEE
jgi:hypothetical protein